MGVDRLPSGSYRARLMVDGQAYTATFDTKREADEWLTVTRGRAIEARAACQRGLTVEHYAQRWLGSFVDDANGVEEFRHDVEQHIVPALGPRPLAEVTTLLQRVEVGVSWPAAKRLWFTLQEFFTDALADGLMARHPSTDGITCNRSRDPALT